MKINTPKAMLAFIPAVLALAVPALAQKPHLNPIQKHPTVTGMAAAAATHHALKVSARNRKAHGQKLNFAQRHPTLSAIGAGALTHHEVKAHTPH
jgi:hypothetical protein